MSDTVWPLFSFYGGKWRAGKRYPQPLHDTIVEPFAGSAGYSMRHAGRRVILVERDPAVVGTWRWLLEATPSEILSLPDLAPGQTVDDLSLCQEARWFIGWWLNKGAASPCKSPSSWMRSGIRPNSYWGRAVRERVARDVEHARHWQIIEGDYRDAPDIEATWFIDPPYSGAAGRLYRHGKDLDYSALAAWCRQRQGQAIVCENVGADWLPFRPFSTIKSNPSRRGRGYSAEAIWTNTGQMTQALLTPEPEEE